MRVLVTGATGFIGRHLVSELLRKGCDIVATARSRKKAKNISWYESVTFIPFVISEDINGFLGDIGAVDVVVHLAWSGLPNYQSNEHIDNNLELHKFFLRSLAQIGISKIVVTGTCLEYGVVSGCLSENFDAKPSTPYAEAKNELRKYLEGIKAEHRFSLCWLRLFYTYGEGQHSGSLIAQLEEAIKNKKAIFNMSYGDQLRDYLPIEVMVSYIAELVIRKNALGVFNCCSGNPISVKSLVSKHIEAAGVSLSLNLGYYPYPKYEAMNFWGDNTKIKKIIQIPDMSSDKVEV